MAVAVALVLFALLLALGLAMAWQERSRLPERARVYGVEDSIVFVSERLTGPAKDELNRHDVRRILEWSVRYLQDPAVRIDAEAPVEFGGLDMGRYIQEQALDGGHPYDGPVIEQVLALQASYFEAIGALGEAADENGPGGIS